MAYKNRMQFNASYGNQLAHTKEDSYFSIGGGCLINAR